MDPPKSRPMPIEKQKLTIDYEKGEILNINKPEGWSSFDVVKKIRNHLKVKKVGHAGTLDPFATGVLLICTGKATKKVSQLMGQKKEYVTEIELGKTTDTYDCTGVVVKETTDVNINREKVEQICQRFVGESYQIPPMYSAIKVGGKRLYQLARQGKTIARTPRKICIYEMEVLDFENPIIKLRVVCSKGTYLRSLAFDIGELTGYGAHLKSLVRTRIGNFHIESSYSINELLTK